MAVFLFLFEAKPGRPGWPFRIIGGHSQGNVVVARLPWIALASLQSGHREFSGWLSALLGAAVILLNLLSVFPSGIVCSAPPLDFVCQICYDTFAFALQVTTVFFPSSNISVSPAFRKEVPPFSNLKHILFE